MEIRNIAIIAHVGHGKTTLTDVLMRQTGMVGEGVTMDSNALELERGITIYSKNVSLFYKGTKINIVDTPGHSDFGSEVERVLRSIDSVILLVDAAEGPMPQTKFVLKKSLELGLKPLVVINKIDRPEARPQAAHEMVLELFMDLGASDEQLNFTVLYAIGRDGIAMENLEDDSKDLEPLLTAILRHVKPVSPDPSLALRMQPFNLAFDNYLGRLAIGRVSEGVIKTGDSVFIKKPSGETRRGKVTKLFTFRGTKREEVEEALAPDIVMVAGLPDIYIGETICEKEDQSPLPAIKVDEPTIVLNFLVNNSPFAGKEGKFVTSREIRERLERELEVNIGLKVNFESPEYFRVYGRGELHIAILLENMRREGYELQVSRPRVIVKEDGGEKLEPFEEVIIDVPTEFLGSVMGEVGKRRSVMTEMKSHGASYTRLVFEMPTRGLLGYRGQFMVDTKGEGILTSRVTGFKVFAGEIERRVAGSMVSMVQGKTLAYALANLEARGTLYIGPSEEVYEGEVIGNTARGDELRVNPTKGKQLTNMRAAGSDENIYLAPPTRLTLERGLEIMAEDEYLEVTPKSIRLRKK